MSEERQKLCTSCEGRIPLIATICPYCAAEQSVFSSQQNALYPPLYPAKRDQNIREEAPEPANRWTKTDALGAPSTTEKVGVQEESDGKVFWPTLLLSLGSNLLLLGILQLCFSNEGMLTLEWSSHFWFLYCLSAIPFLWLGWRRIQQNKI